MNTDIQLKLDAQEIGILQDLLKMQMLQIKYTNTYHINLYDELDTLNEKLEIAFNLWLQTSVEQK